MENWYNLFTLDDEGNPKVISLKAESDEAPCVKFDPRIWAIPNYFQRIARYFDPTITFLTIDQTSENRKEG